MRSRPIDFLRAPRPPIVGWCLLLIGIAALASALMVHRQREIQRAELETAASQRDAAQRRLQEAALRPKVLSADDRRLQKIAAQLQQPWLPTLRAIEGATESPVFLLGLAIDPATGKIQLDAEAPSFDHALVYVQRLSEDGALPSAQMASHESIIDPSGRAAVRFTVVATWSRS